MAVSKSRFALQMVGVILIAGLTACTSAPELAQYPRASIDRPYTLPKPVATWATVVPLGFYRDNTTTAFLPPIPFPLFWRTSLSDNWTLNWSPLPLSAAYQIKRTENQILGLTFGSGFGYASGNIGFLLAPAAEFFYRQKLSPTIALEFGPSVSASVPTGGAFSTWRTDLEMGPVFQLTPLFALRAKATLSLSNGAGPFMGFGPSLTPQNITQFVVPLSVSTTWSIHRQWDLDFGYRFAGIGYANGYSGHTGNVTAVHYW